MSTTETTERKPPRIPEACNVPVSGPIDLKGRVAIVTGARSGIGQVSNYITGCVLDVNGGIFMTP